MSEAALKLEPMQHAQPEEDRAGALSRAALYLVRREDAPARRPRCEPPSPWIALRDLRW